MQNIQTNFFSFLRRVGFFSFLIYKEEGDKNLYSVNPLKLKKNSLLITTLSPGLNLPHCTICTITVDPR